MEQVNLATVIVQVCQEKRISKDVLIETVEQAVLRAAEKVFPDRLMEAEFDTETGQIKLGVVLYVVEEVQLHGHRRGRLKSKAEDG